MPVRSVRIELAPNVNQRNRVVTIVKINSEAASSSSEECRKQLLATAKNKLRVKKPSRLFTEDGAELVNDSDIAAGLRDGCLVLVSSGEDFIGSALNQTSTTQTSNLAQPEIFLEDGVMILLYSDVSSLQQALGRPHVYYEGGTLKGPLKGINFPVDTFRSWKDLPQTGSLTPAEEFVNKLIFGNEWRQLPSQPQTPSKPPIYLIATLASDASSILHEWAHARFHLDTAYYEACLAAFQNLDDAPKVAIEKELAMWNYQPSVFVDEFQAYVVEDATSFGKRWEPMLRPIHLQLKALCGPAPSVRRKPKAK
ncbi:hypothetical protein HDU96_007352 [Phlyctochytrium bullatum]|nr:hypothetical protein HDU96_007352 [Phlyctochytrium bullatum]